MAEGPIASLTLHVDPEELRSIIERGQLLEFANAVTAQAAAEIPAQLVQHVVEGRSVDSELAASVEYRTVVSDGEPGFGTTGHWPPRVFFGGGDEVEDRA